MSRYTEAEDDIFKAILDKFQNERNRSVEESFARAFSENDDTKLFFINEDEAYTDGKNIIVDPAYMDIYRDQECIHKTEKALGWKGLLNDSPWNALKMVTRGLTLHECLHLIYSDFPAPASRDSELDSNNKKKVVADIANIIEDAYIEAVAASVYDNIALYLMFNNYAICFANKKVEGTARKRLKIEKPSDIKEYTPPEEIDNSYPKLDSGFLSDEQKELLEKYLRFIEAQKKIETLITYLNYMGAIIDFPMFEYGDPPDEIAEYVEKTKLLFLEGCVAASPKRRYEISKEIYRIILPLIPDDLDGQITESLLDDRHAGKGTHSSTSGSIGNISRSGKEQEVTTRLFVNIDGSKKPSNVGPDGKAYTIRAGKTGNGINVNYIYTDDPYITQLIKLVNEFKNDEKNVDDLISFKGFKVEHKASNYDASPVHKNIKINENHPKINLNMRTAYKNIFDKYRVNINTYNSRFLQLLQAQVPTREYRYQFGSGIRSRDLGDTKKRYWFRNQMGNDIPDLSVLLLLDGSGSMDGERRNSAMTSSIIFHEVLKKQGIEHAIVEHRARFEAPEVDINILVDFGGKEEEKYNILQLKAEGENRDALALFWAERYINTKTYCENKLIIVISDGNPSHEYDDYTPPVSVKDTANAAKKIMNRGTNIIAVSLDDAEDFSTYEDLKEIYPNLIGCNDLKRLTGQLLQVISKQLR